jgi:hypothetical protein
VPWNRNGSDRLRGALDCFDPQDFEFRAQFLVSHGGFETAELRLVREQPRRGFHLSGCDSPVRECKGARAAGFSTRP